MEPSARGSLTVLSAGSRDQSVLDRSGDNLRIDWGYLHLAVPTMSIRCSRTSTDDVEILIEKTAQLPRVDDLEMPKRPAKTAPRIRRWFSRHVIEGQR